MNIIITNRNISRCTLVEKNIEDFAECPILRIFAAQNRKSLSMLGIITKPFIVKGESAKAVRKAALESCRALKNGKVSVKKPQGRYHFEWK